MISCRRSIPVNFFEEAHNLSRLRFSTYLILLSLKLSLYAKSDIDLTMVGFDLRQC